MDDSWVGGFCCTVVAICQIQYEAVLAERWPD